ncbi:MAG: DUF362 domain-containing protein [Clostridia bacterium]|nr:DUF362 domain-containing protein [Clostridia bacterium]
MVFLQSCDTYERETVIRCMEAIFQAHGGVEQFGGPGKCVVIKPNLVAKKRPEEAATTHPSLVWACAKLLTETGARVVIAESPGGLYDKPVLKSLYRVCGMEEAVKDAGAELNFDTTVTHVQNPEGLYLKQLDVLTPLAKADCIINIAKLKTHGMMAYTGAVKNMFGSIAGIAKAEYHCKMPSYDAFADTILDIYEAVKPTLNIIDAIDSMHKDGPTAGEVIHTGILISSVNGYEADCVAVACIQADPKRIPMMRAMVRREKLSADLNAIPVTGTSIESVTCKKFVMKYNDDCANLHFSDGFLGKMLALALKPRPVFTKKCRSCGECVRCCPVNAIEIEKGKRAKVDLEKCIRCYCCQELCPFKAVKIKKTLLGKVVTK